MATSQTPLRPREQRIEAVITRADGRVERLGVISYYSRNPVKHLAVNAQIWIKAAKTATFLAFAGPNGTAQLDLQLIKSSIVEAWLAAVVTLKLSVI